jgi:hypothetical protein
MSEWVISRKDNMIIRAKNLKSDQKTYIQRWRLEPKDMAAYKRGRISGADQANRLLFRPCYADEASQAHEKRSGKLAKSLRGSRLLKMRLFAKIHQPQPRIQIFHQKIFGIQ